MSKIVLFDQPETRKRLLPLTYTRAVAEIRVGMMTIKEKWEKAGYEVHLQTEDYLMDQNDRDSSNPVVFVDGSICPNMDLKNALENLGATEGIKVNGQIIAFKGTTEDFLSENYLMFKSNVYMGSSLLKLDQCSDIFNKNDRAIREDYTSMTEGNTSGNLSENCTLIGSDLFLGKNVKATAAIFNTEEGPIFLDDGAEVMEGSILRGPLYVGKNAVVKMGAKIYGATTIGPYCKVGGEVGNSVMLGYSNKGHDGYMGNSILGEWCNLGADTNTSNLKNNYSHVKTWSYLSEKIKDTGLTFHGLIMGDHSKSGINTMFNTGTTVGVCANIYGGNFPPKFIPSFSWGGSDGFTTYDFDKAVETATAVYKRRKKDLSEGEKKILRHIFSVSEKYRT